ncbi:MAG: AAA family ATPase [Saprospiraceae bacterium]|nr:AAA family ATPase [Saprospiraceae bacterium]MBK8081624.1 AAA family ATPase [Saprospiraceae bacterium]
MILRNAERQQAKIKLALQGPSGSGKTFSSILLAKGLTNDLSKVCLIDTENGSADLYAHLGDFKVITLVKPYTPERYIQAMELAESAGMECIIIDSISHCWEYLVDFHAGLTGNSFTNWSRITPRLNNLVSKMLTSNAHIIATLRVKQDYILQDKGNGKMIPEKVGLKSIQRDGFDYEFTIALEIDIHHFANCSKDRTGLFINASPFKITEDTGKQILEWCKAGVTLTTVKDLIQKAVSLQDLTEVYKQYTSYYPQLETEFISKKALLTNTFLKPEITEQNGIDNTIH